MALDVRTLADWEAQGVPGLLSVVIPAYNEDGRIEATVRAFADALRAAAIRFEILVVNDGSRDATAAILERLSVELPEVRHVDNPPPHGFGFAVRTGLEAFAGDAVAIVMADMSDRPDDLVTFYRRLEEGYDCVFGTRFRRGGRVVDYPWIKRILNRAANTFIQGLFFLRYNDTTNAFKLYRRSVIAGIQPLLACHFNLTVEMPLKAIVRGYRYAVVPNSWVNRTHGVSKFRIREMGSRYLFIIFYCYIEKLLSRNDYSRVGRLHAIAGRGGAEEPAASSHTPGTRAS
jgi:dolichol-phosphate mannosyltransferase